MTFSGIRLGLAVTCVLLASCHAPSERALDAAGVASAQQEPVAVEPVLDDVEQTVDAGDPASDDAGDPAGEGTQPPGQAGEPLEAGTELALRTLEVHVLYVHGVQNCDGARQNAERSLRDLDAALTAELPERIAAYEASHPGLKLALYSAHANLYTAPSSGEQPSDSSDPLRMDDWEVGDPGCAAKRQGEPCTTAYEWRYRLAQEIQRKIPPTAKNILLVGHSTGARVAFEVAANVGPDGVNTQDWGVQARIAGVVTVHGMLDALGRDAYNSIGPFGFAATCKIGEAVLGFGDGCAHGNGWCEYAADVSGFAAADWVASEKRALMLTGFASCSPSLFSGQTDGPLPIDAQASPLATGISMTTAPGQTLRPAHGSRYGAFCHSTITSGSAQGHAEAVASAKNRVLDWLFVAAPRVVASGSVSVPSLARDQSSPSVALVSALPSGWVSDVGAGEAGVEIAGVCRHPGFSDGDDHTVSADELAVATEADGSPSFRWTQAHDRDNSHAANFFWKLRAVQESSPDLLGALSPN
jgi:hypothetical protein